MASHDLREIVIELLACSKEMQLTMIDMIDETQEHIRFGEQEMVRGLLATLRAGIERSMKNDRV